MREVGMKTAIAETNALACGECGAGLPPQDALGCSVCVYCGTEHRERSSEVIAAAAAIASDPRASSTDLSGILPSFRESEIDLDGGRAPAPSYVDIEDAVRIPLTEPAVLHLLRQAFDNQESVFVCPHIPPTREMAARRAHAEHLPPRERILALYFRASSMMGGEEVVITKNRVCWKNPQEPARSVFWGDIEYDRLSSDLGSLWLDGSERIAISDDIALDACANVFHVLALSATPTRPAVSGVAPSSEALLDEHAEVLTSAFHTYAAAEVRSGPVARAHVASEGPTPDHSCWHCRTPLWESTPRCGYCGALPKPKVGWLKTG